MIQKKIQEVRLLYLKERQTASQYRIRDALFGGKEAFLVQQERDLNGIKNSIY